MKTKGKKFKRCRKCNILKVAEEFHTSKVTKDKLLSYCKTCQNTISRAWQDANREKVNAMKRAAYKNNPQVKIAHYASTLLNRIINGDKGCFKFLVESGAGSREELMRHLKSTIPEGYTIDDYGTRTFKGKLCVDHIKPLSSFDLTNKEERKACYHYKNLRLITKEENTRKYTS